MFFDVEKIVASQVFVALRIVRVDARRFNGCPDDRGLRLFRVEYDRAVESIEPSLHTRENMTDAESHRGVGLVHLPIRSMGGCRKCEYQCNNA